MKPKESSSLTYQHEHAQYGSKNINMCRY